MFITTHKETTHASPEAVWNVLKDTENWDKWDKEIEISTLDGPFEEGTTGMLQTKGSPLFKTVITKLIPNKVLIQEIPNWYVTISMENSISRDKKQTKVTFTTKFKGPFAFFYHLLLRGYLKKKLPMEMEEMLKIASNND